MHSFVFLIVQAGLVFLATAFPHSHTHGHGHLHRSLKPRDGVAKTCRNPASLFDYSAKSHADDRLPICSVSNPPPKMQKSAMQKGAMRNTTEILWAANAAVVDDFTCAPDRPCKNKACCPKKTLSCNFGPEACGTNSISPNEVCWSNCGAKAECGEFADPPGKKCPLNVCCSRWGFCGQTAEFCKKGTATEPGCQSNCDTPRPGSKSLEQTIYIGYYEAWRHNSACQGMGFDDIPVNSLTHLFFSFGYITSDFSIAGMDGLPSSLFSEFTGLKKKNPGLKTVIALGGWTYNNPGPTQKIFSNMVSTPENRSKFIGNLFAFMRQYAFDGVDFDWEYPGADDRGGVPDDGKNFVQFLKELDDENKKQPMHYSVSFTAPSSYWYLRHFDLKAVDYVDFVNMMTYDLHGVWDEKNPIGSHIYGHSNITEMVIAFDLLWRNNVPANKVNMGLGFYGRSFQLEDPACDRPGCVFKGAAEQGACSAEGGILSYREIMEMIKKDNIKPFHDKEAGVKYITYARDQWVSYDDAETFKQKKDLAAELGLAGYLIWAIDQDDDARSALQAVIAPKALAQNKNLAKDTSLYEDSNVPSCYETDCDGNCKPGFIKLSEQKCGKGDKKSKICCPLQAAPDPKDCTWRGNAPLCNGHCNDDEILLALNKWGTGKTCNDGHKAFCCKSPLAQQNKCYWAGVGKKCNGEDQVMTFSGSVLSDLSVVGNVIFNVIGKRHPLAWIFGTVVKTVIESLKIEDTKYYCCPKNDLKKWKSCRWHGKPGSCFDNHCDPLSEVQLTDSFYGGGETCGAGHRERARVFCCQPAEGERAFLPVPLKNLFENPPTGDGVKTDFDLNLKGGDSNPSDTAFQFVVLVSPDELQVSLDKRDGSHWDVFGCSDATTEGEHTVQMVCTDFSENSNCNKIHLGHGVPGTILQMPKGCGPGKYAVAKSMEPAEHQLLPRHLAHLDSRGVVYDLKFDYDFSRVPRDLGNTQMRVDFSNQDNYWDQIVAASPSKKRKRSLAEVGGNHVRWLEEEFRDDYHFGGLDKRELEERWFGASILAWLAKMVSPEIKQEFRHDIDETFTAIIVDEKWECEKNNVKYDGHVSAKALTNMKVSTTFGFTLIVTSLIAPLDLSKSYLTFYNKGEVTATITLDAVANVGYKYEKTILTLPFPGATFRIPGIVTLGPQINIEGSLDAEVSVAGKFETKVDIAKWEVRQTLPDGGSDEFKPKEIGPGDPSLDRTGDFSGIQRPKFYAGVSTHGDITARLRAAAEFGVRFDDRWKVKPAAAGIVGEGSVMVTMAAGISTQSTCPFSYGLQVGAHLYARADAGALNWPEARYDIVGATKDIIEGGTCPNLGELPKRSIPLNFLPATESSLSNGSLGILHGRSTDQTLHKRGGLYGPAFRIPLQDLICPRDEFSKPQEPSKCDYIDVEEPDYVEKRSLLEKRGKKGSKFCGYKELVAVSNYPSAGDIQGASAYGFTSTDCAVLNFGTPLSARVANIGYHTEHVLEFQLMNLFLQSIDGQFDHPDPNETVKPTSTATSSTAATASSTPPPRVKISFCNYLLQTWNVGKINVNGEMETPAQHLADCFPTSATHSAELIVLDGRINSIYKTNAWGTAKNIQANKITDKEITDNPDGAMLEVRMFLGSVLYHKDTTVVKLLKAQAGRVGAMFGLLDQLMVQHPRTVNGVTYDAWKPQGLEAKWNQFLKTQWVSAHAKTTNPIINTLAKLKDVHATAAIRADAQMTGGTADDIKKRAELQRIINRIDDLDTACAQISGWTNPF